MQTVLFYWALWKPTVKRAVRWALCAGAANFWLLCGICLFEVPVPFFWTRVCGVVCMWMAFVLFQAAIDA